MRRATAVAAQMTIPAADDLPSGMGVQAPG
jgi:hypothetical protein